MKFVTFVSSTNETRAGVIVGAGRKVVDLQKAHTANGGAESPLLASVLSIIEGGERAMNLVSGVVSRADGSAVIDLGGVKLLAPLPAPPQMRDFLCFEKHLVQAFQAARRVRAEKSQDPEAAMRDMEAKGILSVPEVWYERPIFYHPNRLNVIGTDTDVIWPTYSQIMDFELEFCAVIGMTGKNIARAEARKYIFGYTIFNDFSARDEQVLEMPGQLGPGKGKDFDGGNALGPCLVTADEIGDPYALEMVASVNGEVWGRGNSAEMRWRFEDCIAHVSRDETLYPGEVLGSGTIGNGCGLENLKFLKDGDVVELEVERIGVLRNRVRTQA
jgi:2-keto-4-pentenoate hydratase/2-oxohepta-3-ene-1,7-dioic acid hydratase in catechol pathway